MSDNLQGINVVIVSAPPATGYYCVILEVDSAVRFETAELGVGKVYFTGSAQATRESWESMLHHPEREGNL